jgi:regulator of protease activity HflC (stomatin/prohibitin superfamily)
MGIIPIVQSILTYALVAAFLLILIKKSFVTVKQGTVGIITRFGKFQKIAATGLNFKVPFIDVLAKTISTQNVSTEVKFQAITSDQANVYFNAMILYSALNGDDDTIQNIAFKFMDTQSFQTALLRSIESSVRGYVSAKKQSEVLQLRNEIVEHVKDELDDQLKGWGYHLQGLQMNDITFDDAIMDSMAQVVASANLKAAAENEGQALLIKKTKAAEADGAAIKISAEAEKTAAKLRGEGIAQFREEVARGMSESAKIMGDDNMGMTAMMFSMWTDAMKTVAEVGKNNIMFFDGSTQGMESTLKQFQAMQLINNPIDKADNKG